MSTIIPSLMTLLAQAAPKLPKLEGTKKLADQAKKLQEGPLNIEGETAVTILKVLVVIVALILVATIIYFLVAFTLRKIRAHRARAAMQRELDQDASHEEDAAGSELIAAFDESIEKISQSSKGERALDVLPWYIVLGPEGVGKRSLLRHSGLDFPVLRGNERGIPDLQKGPTEHCDLWISDQAVFVDLANRYIDVNHEPEELAALLGKIAKRRNETPINGVVLTIDQISLSEDEGRQNSRQSRLHKLGRNLRASIDQISDLLGHTLPVYTFVSQCDRLVGFREFVSTLNEEQRHKALGITLPMVASTAEHHKQLERGLDKLSDSLYEHVTRSIANAASEQDSEILFSFPQRFSELRDGLGHFTTALLHNNGRSEALHLRGVYFASAQQEQDALEHLLRSRGRSAARSNIALDQSGPTQSGLFTKGVFLDVVFPDRAFSQPTRRSQEQQMRHTLMWSVGIGTAALALLILPWNAAVDYKDLEQSAVQHVRTLDSGDHPLAKYQTRTAVDTYRSMANLETRLDTLNDVKIAGLTWGMSNHSEIQPAYTDFTRRVVTHWAKDWIHDLVEKDRKFLENIVLRYGESLRELRGSTLRATYTALGRYVLLTETDGTQARTSKQRDWLKTHLKSEQATLDKLHQQNNQRSLKPSGLADRLAQAVVNDDGLRQRGDRNLTRRVRRLLRDVEADHTPEFVEQLVADASATTRVHRIDITSFTDSASREFLFIDKKNPMPFIPGAYTKEVWMSMVRPGIEEEVKSPGYLKTRDNKSTPPIWIRGLPSLDAWHQERRENLRQAYKHAYESTWKAFINTIRIDLREGEVGYAYGLLEKLSDAGTSPYYRLFELVAQNSLLPEAKTPVMEGDKDAPAAQPDIPLESLRKLARFGASVPGAPRAASLPLDIYTASLGKLRDSISEQGGGQQQAEAFRAQNKRTTRTIERLITQHPSWSGPLRKLLVTPTQVAVKDVFRSRSSSLKGQWCNNIVSTFRAEFRHKYPFAPTNRKGVVDLDQLTNFFHPDTGALWQQVGALGDFVEKKGDRFYGISRPNQPAISERFLTFLNDSWLLAKALFPPGSAAPSVVMQIEVLPRSGIQRTEFRFGEEVLEQLNGPSMPARFEWPAKGDSSDVLLLAWYSLYKRGAATKPRGKINPLPQGSIREPVRIPRKGPWALFNFIESASKVENLSDNEFTLSWYPGRNKGDPPVVLRFKLQQGVSLFFADPKNSKSLFRRFRVLAQKVPNSVFAQNPNQPFVCPTL